MGKRLPVRIYAWGVQIDGYEVKRDELEETLRELYEGIKFTLQFVCSLAPAHWVERCKEIMGLEEE